MAETLCIRFNMSMRGPLTTRPSRHSLILYVLALTAGRGYQPKLRSNASSASYHRIYRTRSCVGQTCFIQRPRVWVQRYILALRFPFSYL